jgi:anti-anti-sigma factor
VRVNYLRTTVTVEPAQVTVVLEGEIDFYSAPELREQLLTIIREFRPPALILDCSQLTFIDAAGIGVLVGTHERLASTNGKSILRNVSKTSRRVLDLTQVSSTLNICSA